MNAAKAKKSPAKVKGAVLIMILAVMTVMIILLAGSIAVVYSAHNRAAVKYSESQGYYTARSVLDNFFSELSESTDQKDSTNTNIGTYYQLDLENNTVLTKPLCIGRSIELELYKPVVNLKDSSGNYYDWFKDYCDTNKSSLSAQINGFEGSSVDYTSGSDGNNTALYAKVANYYVNLNKASLGDYSTYSNFYNQYTPVSTVATGMDGDTIIYEIDSLDGFGSGTIDTDGDGNPDTNSQFGKLSDTGASKAWITVQVTERILAMGDGTTYADRFKSGKRSDDHIVAKVTAHVIYDGEEITTTQIWVSSPPPVVDADTGLSSLGPINDSASITAVGDVATLTQNVSKFSNDPTFSGNVYFEGSLEHNNTDATATLEDGEVFFVGGTYKTSVNKFKGVNRGSIFYARRFQLWSQNTLTDNNTEINVIAKTFEIHSSDKKVYGRIFAENFDSMTSGSVISKNSVKSTVQSGHMTFNTTSPQIYGDVYCNYLGVPADRVTVEFKSNGVAIFHVNYDPGGNQIIQDNNKVENVVASGYKIHVLKGIKIIDGVEEETIGKDKYGNAVKTPVNTYESYLSSQTGAVSKTVDYFTDAGSGGANMFGTTIAKMGLETDFPLKLHPGSEAYDSSKEYQVQIDFSACDASKLYDGTKLNIKLNLDYYAFVDENGDGKPDANNPWTLTDDYYKEFTLPSGYIDGKKVGLINSTDTKFRLPTHRSIYKNYFYTEITGGTTGSAYPKTFNDYTGAFTMDMSDPSISETDKQTFLVEHAITAEALLAKLDTSSTMDIDNVPEMGFLSNACTVGAGGGDTVNGVYMPASNNVISSSGYIAGPDDQNQFNSYRGKIFYIDARDNDLDIQIGNGDTTTTMAACYVVYGNKHVTVTVPGTRTGGNAQVLNWGDSSSKFIFTTAEIFGDPNNSDSEYNKYKSDQCLVIGTAMAGKKGGTVTTAPNIDWYVSKNIKTINIGNGGGINNAPANSNCTYICGYITAPLTDFNIENNLNGVKRETYYLTHRIEPSSNENYLICGSIFCRSYTGGQHAGVCYIPRDDSYVDDGSKPLLNKVGMYRSRS